MLRFFIIQDVCGVCHNGASPEAPNFESLKLLPEAQILAAMKTGVMQNQAMTLSDDQHKQLAAYISSAEKGEATNSAAKGLCAEEDAGDYQSASPQIDNWGLGLKNQRYYNRADLKINARNVGNLELSWVFAFSNASRARIQPTIAGNTLFTASQTGTIYALDFSGRCRS